MRKPVYPEHLCRGKGEREISRFEESKELSPDKISRFYWYIGLGIGTVVWGNLKTGHVDQRKMGHSGPTDYPLFIA